MTAIDQRRTTSRAVLTILRAREVGLVVLIALVAAGRLGLLPHPVERR